MERLTIDGMEISKLTVNQIIDIYFKLMEYEDTEETPNSVINLKIIARKQSNSIFELGGKLEQMDKELEFWKREAIKLASQLGETKLWLGSEGMEVDKVLKKVKNN